MKYLNILSVALIIFMFNNCIAAYTVKPGFSEFSISFPAEPEYSIFSFTGNDGVDVDAVRYELLSEGSVLRVEFLPISNPILLDAVSDKEIREQMLAYVRHNGLKSSHVTVEHEKNFRVAAGRSTKILSHEGHDIAVTYVNKAYCGQRSIMMLYVGAPSAEYPTDKIMAFLESVSIDSADIVPVESRLSLREAAAQGFLKTVQEYIRDSKAEGRETMMGQALISACAAGQANIVEWLLANGADPNIPDMLKWYPLHHVSRLNRCHSVVANFLTRHGADVSVIDDFGRTPLHRAASYGCVDIVVALLDAGASASIQDNKGLTPADRALLYPDLARELRKLEQ